MLFYPLLNTWYRLTNLWTGDALSLEVVNNNGTHSSGTLQMGASGGYSGQCWRFQPNPAGSTSTYALYTRFLGEGKRLDVYGNDKTTPHLAPAGSYTGQIWTMTSWGDGTYMLTNSYSGSGLHLDVSRGAQQPFLEGGNRFGQHWVITPFVAG